MPDPRLACVVLAGGRAARLGGLPKTRLLLGGSSSLDRVLQACPEGEHVVVGPPGAAARGARFVQEDPPFGGPVAALAAGLTAVGSARQVLVLAADMPYLTSRAVHSLLDGPATTVRAAVDREGRVQYLCSCWPVEVLRDALAVVGSRPGTSMRRLFATLGAGQPVLVPVDPDELADLDTPEDLRAAESRFTQCDE